MQFKIKISLDLHMGQDSMCSWVTRRSSSFMLSALSSNIWVSSVGTLLGGSFPSPVPPFSFHCFISVTGAYFLPFAQGLLAGLPGFANHGSGLHLGAGCQWWKLLDASGTQPPLCEAVVSM